MTLIINVTLSDLMQAKNWHDAGHKTDHGGPDLVRGPPVWHPCISLLQIHTEIIWGKRLVRQ